MKIKIKTFTAIVALGIFSIANVNATGTSKSRVIVSEVEKSLIVEPWMLDNEYWEARLETVTVESEKALEVESWMLADENFLSQYQKEQELDIESWMTDASFFCSAKSVTDSRDSFKNRNYFHSHRPNQRRN